TSPPSTSWTNSPPRWSGVIGVKPNEAITDTVRHRGHRLRQPPDLRLGFLRELRAAPLQREAHRRSRARSRSAHQGSPQNARQQEAGPAREVRADWLPLVSLRRQRVGAAVLRAG